MSISVVVPALNESHAELAATIASIRDAADEPVEIILCDDCSSTPLPQSGADKLIVNKHRVGGGAARHIGALTAAGDILVFTDSHCRFTPGWVKAVTHSLRPGQPRLLCGQMLALEANDELPNHRGAYWGGKLVLHDPTEKENRRILASKWRNAPNPILSATMGAAYAIQKEFFFHLSGMSQLYGFGSEEEFLSMKTILAGGQICLVEGFKVGHRFRSGKPPYRLELWEKYFNTMVCAHVCCPSNVAEDLIGRLGLNVDIQRAKDEVKKHWNTICAELTHLRENVFKISWDVYLSTIREIDSSNVPP